MIVGLLLAGGRSSRFGSEKAVFDLGSGLMMDGPLSALGSVCAATAVSARPGSGAQAQADMRGLPCLHDRPDDPEGPLAGFRVGLEWASAQGAAWLMTAPCDSPRISARDTHALLEAVRSGAGAAVALSPRGLEPLLAIWPASRSLDIVAAVLDAGRHPPVRTMLEMLDAVPVTGHDGLNVNRREDLHAR
ncbi:molybdenum cofactor guanylyltransferase [Brevundimonas sp. PAMC22021]|uniref:molybdenum cofactor guanylyltransferase n=1 Tax=Brevundimonas sp. PAMC22021 TaxID=2861285 RepID=UPI001C6268DB|nr:molybdenum cofactor guanylyltransferase [Brevundimonas sp. PAMC22021]QYF87379.1 molybdenum cofactor guanylyltransferase [Brevundimonas sp. PAMC22021]